VNERFLEAIEQGRRLNAFLSVFRDKALDRARAVDKKLAAGAAGLWPAW